MLTKISQYIRISALRGRFGLSLLVVGLSLLLACSDDDKELACDEGYGYAQFSIVKAGTRAAMLENLGDAEKIAVVLTHEGAAFTQTLALQRYDDESAEMGMQSDKLQLLAGHYTLTGFYLYDKLGNEIYAGEAGDDAEFDVVKGGLHLHRLDVNSVLRGMVTFQLVKHFTQTRAEGGEYPFASIRGASFTVRNVFTHEEYMIERVRVDVNNVFETVDESRIQTTVGDCDTLVWLPVGNYQVTAYTTYSDTRCRYVLESANVSNAATFVVRANATTEHAQVPITFSTASERIKDYLALKAIWEALDGRHWDYHGEAYAAHTNWNFDKDIDLWGQQPGVSLDANGRVTVISLIGFGIRGVLPDDVGQLSELRVLYLGAHDEALGSVPAIDFSNYDSAEWLAARRGSYAEMFLRQDAREGLSATLREHINNDPEQRPIRSARIERKDVQMGYFTNQLTGISRAIKRCNKLQQLYIANSPITHEGFFRDVDPDSPYYDPSARWEDFINLTDIEIYNCPRLTAMPLEMLAHLPELQLLNMSDNPGISASQLKADWEALIDGACGDKLQVLYLGYCNLEETPSYEQLNRMRKLAWLDISHNKLHTVHPFGKEVNLVKLYLNDNCLTHIPTSPDGQFSDYMDVEIMDFSYNQLTEVPDIFNARSIFTIQSVVLSHNNITSLEHGEAFRGINASSVDLSYNRFEVFPKELFTTGSPIQSLVMSGNALREIPEGAMTGAKSSYLVSIDLSNNKLSSLPDDFYATNLPYLYGLDLSGNQFESIPYKPFDCYRLTVLVMRNQRDDAGNRTLRGWLQGIYQHPSLRALYLGGNDLRKIEDTISPTIYIFEIKDNPNISIDMSDVCPYIAAGYYMLFYDRTQDIRGCPSLQLNDD